jgi:hypothetical protein
MYTAIVLNDEGHNRILEMVNPIPGWKVYAHHLTLHMGPATELEKVLLGKEYVILINGLGTSQLACAARASWITWEDTPINSANKIPHITLYVNTLAGGKPKDSNDITEWYSVDPFVVRGVLQEQP